MIANSYVTTTYNFGWLGDFAHFDAYTNHHLEQLDGRTISEGRIRVTPAVDTNISFNGRWQFSWPGSVIGSASLVMDVYDLAADELVVIATAFGGNLGLGPPYGTLSVQHSAQLLAGGQYEIVYSTRMVLVQFEFRPFRACGIMWAWLRRPARIPPRSHART